MTHSIAVRGGQQEPYPIINLQQFAGGSSARGALIRKYRHRCGQLVFGLDVGDDDEGYIPMGVHNSTNEMDVNPFKSVSHLFLLSLIFPSLSFSFFHPTHSSINGPLGEAEGGGAATRVNLLPCLHYISYFFFQYITIF